MMGSAVAMMYRSTRRNRGLQRLPEESQDMARSAARLRFPAGAETAFRSYYSRHSLVIVRIAILLTVVLYGLFAVLDLHAAPISRQSLWFIRFALVIPSLLGVLIFSFHPIFLRMVQPMMTLVVGISAAGILAMIGLESPGELGFHAYYAGLMLVIMAAHTVYRLRFVYATGSSILVLAGYDAIAIAHQNLLVSGDGFRVFLSNNFFFGSSLILGMAASYFLEVHVRSVYGSRIRLAGEREKSERLLRNILPREIAATLKEREGVIADHFDEASILFADVSDFTSLSANRNPREIVGLLDEIFSHFDDLAGRYGLEKIKTIGDCYMVAAGVPRWRHDHAHVLARLGLEMLAYVKRRGFGDVPRISLRVGIHSGPVVAGVIGRKKFIYDLWGDTVNVASRMEHHGSSGRVQITTSSYERIKDDFLCEPRGTVWVKGKGEMPVWHVLSEKTSHSAEGTAPSSLHGACP
jgi:class 3 adenylate cyclase